MTNTEIAGSFYSNMVAGNIPAALDLFDAAIEWHECRGMPFITGDGIFTGPEAVVSNVFMQLPVYFDNFHIDVTDIFGAGEKVTMTGFYMGTNKASGKPFRANATHVWTVKDGKLSHFFQAVDTLAITGI